MMKFSKFFQCISIFCHFLQMEISTDFVLLFLRQLFKSYFHYVNFNFEICISDFYSFRTQKLNRSKSVYQILTKKISF